MKNLKKAQIRHGFVLAILTVMAVLYLFLVTPTHPALVGGGILLIGVWAYSLTGMFAKRTYQFIAFLATICYLIMNYFVGFELVNTFLYISFIIGVIFLLR